jgi:HTH-type transcriptional regulator/antitoxin HipB
MEYTVHTTRQLAQALRSQRSSKRLTQKVAGAPVGLLPKTVSALESSPQRSSVESLFKLLSALELELVLRSKSSEPGKPTSSEW